METLCAKAKRLSQRDFQKAFSAASSFSKRALKWDGGLNYQQPSRRVKSLGDKTGQEALNNLNREEAGKSLKQKQRKQKRPRLLSLPCGFPGRGRARLARRCRCHPLRWPCRPRGGRGGARTHPPPPFPRARAFRKLALALPESSRDVAAGPGKAGPAGSWPRGAPGCGRGGHTSGRLFHSASCDHSPRRRAMLHCRQPQTHSQRLPPAPCRPRPSPEPSTPNAHLLTFYSFRSRLLQEAFPGLPRTEKCAVFCVPHTALPALASLNLLPLHLLPTQKASSRRGEGRGQHHHSCSHFNLQHIPPCLAQSGNYKAFLEKLCNDVNLKIQ